MATLPAGARIPLPHKGELRVCESPDGLPYLGATTPADASGNGKVSGFDVDLLTLVATRLHAAPVFIRTDPRLVLDGSGLRAKTCDLVTGLTTWRGFKKTFTLTKPYDRRDFAILTKKGGPATLAALAGKRVGVVGTGEGDVTTDYVAYLKRYNAAHGNRIVLEPQNDPNAELMMAQAGRLDAIVTDDGRAYYDAKKTPGLTVGARFGAGYTVVFGVRKGNKALAKQVDAALADAAGNGQYAKAYRTWFGRAPSWLPR